MISPSPAGLSATRTDSTLELSASPAGAPRMANAIRFVGLKTIKIAIEAASPLGWERYIGESGAFVGIEDFGASAPYKELYWAFGITAETAAEAALVRLGKKEMKHGRSRRH